jgi:hypothetical protein
MLSVNEVRATAQRPVHIGLVADSSHAYAELEEFLLPSSLAHEERQSGLALVHRASDPEPPSQVDLVLYEPGLSCPAGAYTYRRGRPEETVAEILKEKDETRLALARHYPVFREPVVEAIIHEVARENTLFAVATALPNVIPNWIELPWAFGEFASDTFFLTANQMRMAFQIAAASGSEVGLQKQKFELAGIAGSAFGWRALARELVSHVPFGGGLIPKGAIAYAGTYMAGKALERLHLGLGRHSGGEEREIYERALERGRQVVREARAS